MTNTPDNIRNMWEQAAGINEAKKDLAALVKPQISSGDLVFCTGAGTVTYWAAALADQLKNS